MMTPALILAKEVKIMEVTTSRLSPLPSPRPPSWDPKGTISRVGLSSLSGLTCVYMIKNSYKYIFQNWKIIIKSNNLYQIIEKLTPAEFAFFLTGPGVPPLGSAGAGTYRFLSYLSLFCTYIFLSYLSLFCTYRFISHFSLFCTYRFSPYLFCYFVPTDRPCFQKHSQQLLQNFN